MPRNIEFIYFDLGKVLLDFDHQLGCRQMANVLGVTERKIFEDIFRSGIQHRYESGDMTTAQLHDYLCVRYGSAASQEEVALAAGNIFTEMHASVELARELAQLGHRMGILSNTCDCHWEFCLRRPFSFLTDLFSVHALSFRLGVMKPDPSIYLQAAEMCGAHPQSIFFVDDKAENVESAASTGFDAVQFQSAVQLRHELVQRELLAA